MDATVVIPNDLPDSTDLPDNHDDWLHKIEHYLSTDKISPRIEGDARKKLALCCQQFTLVDGLIYYRAADRVLRQVARHHEFPAILAICHAGIAGGHYVGNEIPL